LFFGLSADFNFGFLRDELDLTAFGNEILRAGGEGPYNNEGQERKSEKGFEGTRG